ncbi:rhodanese-like domain-containing protein [Thermodesulfobacteriota bacterium]
MRADTLFSPRFFFEVALLCCIGLGAGLAVNYRVVLQGFDGSLTTAIRQQLKSELEARSRDSAEQTGEAAITVLEYDRARGLFESGTALFVDARPGFAYEAGHISGAVNITAETLDEQVFALMDALQQGPVVLYCTGVDCPEAMELAELMVAQDLRPVCVFLEGWEKWTALGCPTATGAEP